MNGNTRKAQDCPQCNLVYYSKGALTRHLKTEHGEEPLSLHERFLAKYFNLDKSERRQIILYFHDQPFTWNPIWIEVSNKTAMSNLMLAKMEEEGTI